MTIIKQPPEAGLMHPMDVLLAKSIVIIDPDEGELMLHPRAVTVKKDAHDMWLSTKLMADYWFAGEGDGPKPGQWALEQRAALEEEIVSAKETILHISCNASEREVFLGDVRLAITSTFDAPIHGESGTIHSKYKWDTLTIAHEVIAGLHRGHKRVFEHLIRDGVYIMPRLEPAESIDDMAVHAAFCNAVSNVIYEAML